METLSCNISCETYLCVIVYLTLLHKTSRPSLLALYYNIESDQTIRASEGLKTSASKKSSRFVVICESVVLLDFMDFCQSCKTKSKMKKLQLQLGYCVKLELMLLL